MQTPMAPAGGPRRLEQMSWPAARQLAQRRGSTVIWPFGACEQHGPHLPLGTDALFADRLTDAVLSRLDPQLPIVRLPVQSPGFSPEHGDFPGTLSLPANVLLELVLAVGRNLATTGFQRLLLLNGHGGQIALLEVAGRQLRSHCPQLAVLPCFLWRGVRGISDRIPEPERSQGLHAGLAETALMLHLEPSLVGALPAADGFSGGPTAEGWSLEGDLPCSWLTSDLSSSGVIGDPSGADPHLGAALFEALVDSWQRNLEALMASDWPTARQP